MTVQDRVIPQLLGVDIGCGMTCVKLNRTNAEFQKLDKVIRENVPSGFAVRREPHHMAGSFLVESCTVSAASTEKGRRGVLAYLGRKSFHRA